MPHDVLADLLLRGIAIGALLALGIGLVRGTPGGSLRIASFFFILSNIIFILGGLPQWRAFAGPAYWPLWLVQIGGAGFFWLFVRTLFEDRSLSARDALVPLGLVVLGLVGLAASGPVARIVWGVHNAAGLTLAVLSLLVIARSWRDDLVEERRRLRGPFLSAAALFSVILSIVQIGQVMGYDAAWYELAFAAIQATLGVAGAAILLEPRQSLFGAATPATAAAPAPDAAADALWLARLDEVMREQAMWRQEGLTIADVAAAVGLPEHRLRRLINDRLGHRNFPAFVNRQRIEAARAALADPAQATRTVATIAYDLGFGSLGPFNRAFRDATGQTPTDFRRSALDVWSRGLMVHYPCRHGRMRYGTGSSRERPHDGGSPSSDTA
jgi:AraC-like DNA-binding protein